MKPSIGCAFNADEKILAFRRAVKKTRRNMIDFVADTAFAVKRQPFKAIGVAAGVAFAMGAFTGRFVKR
jgi:ElaB/YqjD/DUF883 family membrane-anchored ribosome-binding protein